MGLVTTFCPPMMTGAGELVVQTAGERLVADRKVNPEALVGHVKITLAPDNRIDNCDPNNERLNNMPLSEPAPASVPYRLLPDKTNPACG